MTIVCAPPDAPGEEGPVDGDIELMSAPGRTPIDSVAPPAVATAAADDDDDATCTVRLNDAAPGGIDGASSEATAEDTARMSAPKRTPPPAEGVVAGDSVPATGAAAISICANGVSPPLTPSTSRDIGTKPPSGRAGTDSVRTPSPSPLNFARVGSAPKSTDEEAGSAVNGVHTSASPPYAASAVARSNTAATLASLSAWTENETPDRSARCTDVATNPGCAAAATSTSPAPFPGVTHSTPPPLVSLAAIGPELPNQHAIACAAAPSPVIGGETTSVARTPPPETPLVGVIFVATRGAASASASVAVGAAVASLAFDVPDTAPIDVSVIATVEDSSRASSRPGASRSSIVDDTAIAATLRASNITRAAACKSSPRMRTTPPAADDTDAGITARVVATGCRDTTSASPRT
eukprot:29989-Pelagococcus_subviridis.AAC.7